MVFEMFSLDVNCCRLINIFILNMHINDLLINIMPMI